MKKIEGNVLQYIIAFSYWRIAFKLMPFDQITIIADLFDVWYQS